MAFMRRWDVPYAEGGGKCPLSSRAVKCSPRDRGKLTQRSRLAQVSQLGARQDPIDRPGAEKTLDMRYEKEGRETPPAQGPPRSASAAAAAATAESKDRFYGSMSGTQVEEELRRLGELLRAQSRDVVVMKDTLWHLEDEQGRMQARWDGFEQNELKDLSVAAKDMDSRLLASSEQVHQLDVRTTRLESAGAQSKHSELELGELVRRLDLLDASCRAQEDAQKHAPAAASARAVRGSPAAQSEPGNSAVTGYRGSSRSDVDKAASYFPDITELLTTLDDRPGAEEKLDLLSGDPGGTAWRGTIAPRGSGEGAAGTPGTRSMSLSATYPGRPHSAIPLLATEEDAASTWGCQTFPQDSWERRVRPGRSLEMHGRTCPRGVSQTSSTASRASASETCSHAGTPHG